MRKEFFACLCVLCAYVVMTGMSLAAAPQEAGPPVVIIEWPASGVTSSKILDIRGSISDPAIENATIIHNGQSYKLRVRSGRFERNIVASPGENWIQVVAANSRGTGKGTVFLKASVEPMDMKIILTWDTDQTDIDLWVTDPKEEKCFYQNRTTAVGGLLDLDVTDGYGPETFTLPRAMAGAYLVSAHYYGRGNDLSSPVNVKLEVVLYEGTPREQRKVYSTYLHKVNDVVDIANLLIQ